MDRVLRDGVSILPLRKTVWCAEFEAPGPACLSSMCESLKYRTLDGTCAGDCSGQLVRPREQARRGLDDYLRRSSAVLEPPLGGD